MFERFSTQARHAVELARSEAIQLGADRIGCEHLLLGLAHGRTGAAADALTAAGLELAGLRELAAAQHSVGSLDAEALGVLGIDLDQVRRAAEAAFGPGALDRPRRRSRGITHATMTPDARKALECALRQVHRDHDRSLRTGHLLIGIIDQGDNTALRVLTAAGADLAALRADTQHRLTLAA